MNFTIIPARIQCTRCSNIQETGQDHCSACGASFVFDKSDAWEQQKYTLSTPEYPCLHDNIPPGTVMGVVCNCPKCRITY